MKKKFDYLDDLMTLLLKDLILFYDKSFVNFFDFNFNLIIMEFETIRVTVVLVSINR